MTGRIKVAAANVSCVKLDAGYRRRSGPKETQRPMQLCAAYSKQIANSVAWITVNGE